MRTEWSDKKETFYRNLVTNGVTTWDELKDLYPFGWEECLTDRLKGMFEGFYKTPCECAMPKGNPRLVNRFPLGADPEFVFVDRDIRVDASTLNMKAGLAYGADNNGRLVEIRPYPARFQVDVLASVLSTMRWMSVMVPNTQRYEWQAGAFLFNDGLGGHVHMGRKQTHLRDKEVLSLDKLSIELEMLGVYPKLETERRRRGDQFGQLYGQRGDIRLQKYGYEYRTFPSWLDSPWMAYFHLVLSKLAVYDPELFHARDTSEKHLSNLLHYFKSLDDDARVAHWALKRWGIPRHIGGDFRARWGLTGYENVTSKVKLIPQSIKPNRADSVEVWEHLVYGTPLKVSHLPEPSWSPTTVPTGFAMALTHLETRGQKGLGEMLWNVVIPAKAEFDILPMRAGVIKFQITEGMLKYMRADWHKTLPKDSYEVRGHGNLLYIDTHGDFSKAKDLLLGGVFPFWDVRKVTETTLADWAKTPKGDKKPLRHLLGEELYKS